MSTQITTRTVYMWSCPSCRLDGSLSTDLSVTQSEAEAHDVDVHGVARVTVGGLR